MCARDPVCTCVHVRVNTFGAQVRNMCIVGSDNIGGVGTYPSALLKEKYLKVRKNPHQLNPRIIIL